MDVKAIVAKIKEKKEFNAIEDRFVREELIKYLKQNKKAMLAIQEGRTRSEDYKNAVKAVRAMLRRVYGVFLAEGKEQREELLEKGEYDKILETHLSTKERMLIYPSLYEKIFAITGKPKIILDLGCGLNPVSYDFMKTNAEYYCAEISQDDVDFLNKFFERKRILGKAIQLDLIEAANNPEKLNFPKADICFMFKILDEIERKKGRKTSEALIKAVNADWLVISFATKKVTGKPMKYPFRRWLEQMLRRLGYKFEIIKESNEIFYVANKLL